MIYLSDAYAITRRYNCRFVILKIVFSQRFLGSNKERIFTIFHRLVRIAITCTNVRNFAEHPPSKINRSSPEDTKSQQLIPIEFILLLASCKLRCKLRCKICEII